MMSKNLQRYCTLKMSNKRFIIQRFRFPKILTCQGYYIFCAVGKMRRVQISCDICTRFARYLYPTKHSASADNPYLDLDYSGYHKNLIQ